MPRLKNNKHETLVQEYLIDLNQTQAAIRAGYSPISANQQAVKLFANASIRARVEEMLAERSARTGVNQDRIVRELARIAFAQAPDVINIEDATLRTDANEDDLAVIQSVKVKSIPTADGIGHEREIRLADKIKALELLGKHTGMFTDKLELSGKLPLQVVIEDDYGDDAEREGEMEQGIPGG